MKCDRCGTEMRLGIATPSIPDGVLAVTGAWPISWPYNFQQVLKCPSCGRSLSEQDIEWKNYRKAN